MNQTTVSTQQLIIVDSQVNNWQSLVSNAGADTAVLILDSSSDGLTQISDYLTAWSANAGAPGFTPLQSIQIISHGGAGSLLLGSSTVTDSNLSLYSRQLATIGKALSENGDILLYGCNVAADPAGVQFINRLAALTNADVAASNDLTGAAALGGDWLLEAATGTIDSSSAFNAADYAGTLAVNTAPAFSVGDGRITTTVGSSSDAATSVAVQADGKMVLGGYSWNGSNYDFALTRYNSSGSLDTGFSGDGKVTTAVGSGDDYGQSVAVQADGKIVLGGFSWNDGSNGTFVLTRYNSNGSLDTGFGVNGKVTTILDGNDYGYSVTVQNSGKILLSGFNWNENGDGSSNGDFAQVRYNSDGSLDTGFGSAGKTTTALSGDDYGYSAAVQADGKILVAGYNWNVSNYDFALMRYNSNGSLDTSFGGDGKVTTAVGAGDDYGYSVTVQDDGKILLGGTSYNSSNGDFALVRYNSDGSLDTGFDGDGKVVTALSSDDYGYSVAVQDDGKILLSGSADNGSNASFVLARYNSDGSLDGSFDAVNTLNSTPRYTENGAAAVLDSTVQIYDAELADQGHYNGASITLARHGGANSQDVFAGSGNLSFSGSNVLLSAVNIGTVSNSNGTLAINFNSNATQARVNTALSSLAYRNTSDNPAASVQIDWTFSDGNTGTQGTGGALRALGSTAVNITAVNDAPVLTTPIAISYTDTIFDDTFASVSRSLVASDADSSRLTYSITGGTDNGLSISKSSAYGMLTVIKATGVYSFVANDAAIEPLTAAASTSFTVTVSDGSLSNSKILTINIAQRGVTESIGNNTLTGTAGNDKFDGLAGNDIINGMAGADTMKGGLGNDTYFVDNAGDVVTETSTLASEVDTVNSSISYALRANLENLVLTGTAAINGTANTLNNVLTGNTGANILIGGLGKDTLTGGSGADKFKFNAEADTGAASTRDIIVDFSSSQGDKVDLSAIDADTAFAGNNAFVAPTVGGTFSGIFANPGELYFDQAAHILYGNNDADSAADFSIQLTGVNNLTAGDLVL